MTGGRRLDYYAVGVHDDIVTRTLDPRAARVLVALHRVPAGLRLSDLAAVNGIGLSSAQRVVGTLQQDGWVVREPSYRPKYRIAPGAPNAAIDEVARWQLSPVDLESVLEFLDQGLASPTLDGHMLPTLDRPTPDSVIRVPKIARQARRRLLGLVAKRARPGAGSDLPRLMNGERPLMTWWAEADAALRDVPHAAIGAVAANRFMPARGTDDLDLAVRIVDLPKAEAALVSSGWRTTATLHLHGGLAGKAWVDPTGHELDVIGLPGAWGEEAISAATFDQGSRMRTVTLPYAVLTKMISSRAQDVSDISRMLGSLTDEDLVPVIALTKQHMAADDLDDLEQIIALGRLEAERSEGTRKPP